MRAFQFLQSQDGPFFERVEFFSIFIFTRAASASAYSAVMAGFANEHDVQALPLPVDVMRLIVRMLRPKDLCRAAQVSRSFRKVAGEDAAWARHCHLRQLPASEAARPNLSLKDIYRTRFLTYDYVITLAVCGDQQSGKETLVRTFLRLEPDDYLLEKVWVFGQPSSKKRFRSAAGLASERATTSVTGLDSPTSVPFSVLEQSELSGTSSVLLDGFIIKLECVIVPLEKLKGARA